MSNIEDLLAPSQLPEGHDPLADGILMQHQRDWLEDDADLKIVPKGRRTGITYAEALDDTLIAAAARSAGGDNIFYIGDTKEKGLEFIKYVAHFAKVVAKELAVYEEYLFEDKQDDGTSKYITAYRVRFASGFQVAALSSRPANIRGLQGIVVIDEAAFHPDVQGVLDAVNALLIWGGKIRIISSHNGEDNPFNQLIKDSKAGLYDYSIHHIPFSLAVKNGLYERVCLMRGWTPTPDGKQAWLDKIIRSYGPRREAREEELEAIPRKSAGIYLPRALIRRAQIDGVPIITWSQAEDWYLDNNRMSVARAWFRDHVAPLLKHLDSDKRTVFGQDFGRTGDLSVILISQEVRRDYWEPVLQIELRRIPFDVQQYIVHEILDRLPRFSAAFDARGNGQSHAEAAQQTFGANRVACVMATAQYYATIFPAYRAALEEPSFRLPPGEDVVADHRLVILRRGNPAVSDDHNTGEDGEQRHGDGMIAAMLAFACTEGAFREIGYDPVVSGSRQTLGRDPGRLPMTPTDDDDDAGRDPSGLRGSIFDGRL